jgi:integrase
MAIHYGPWRIKSEKQRGVDRLTVIRYKRLPDGTQTVDRLPVQKYEAFRDKPEELTKLIDRLNYTYNRERLAKEKVKFKHAFIDDALLEEFRDLLAAQIPTRDKVSTNMYYLKNYFLNYFIQTLDLANPQDWYQVQATKWASFLQSAKAPSAASTKRDIIQVANRFMKWLHGKRPDEVPMFVFDPLSKSVLKKIEAERKMNDEDTDRTNIPDADWKIIKEKLPDNLKSAALIAYHYGLRRAEVLGLAPADVKNGHLHVRRQLAKLLPEPQYGPLKGRGDRKVPHWSAKPVQVHKWIVDVSKYLVHPDTLSDRWLAFMEKLKTEGKVEVTYDFHDLRHTFITKALNDQTPKAVMFAAGHKNLETTMRYTHDDSNTDDDVFDPKAA